MARKPLGEILQEMKVLSGAALEQTLTELRTKPGSRLGDYLVAKGLVTDEDVAYALALQFDLPYGTVESLTVDPKIARSISEDYARRQRALPLYEQDGELQVAVVDPLDVYVLDDISFVVGARIRAVVVTPDTLDALIKQVFGGQDDSQAPTQRRVRPANPEPPSAPARAAGRPDAEEAAVVRIADELLTHAVEQEASDIHIEPMAEGLRVRFRLDGVLNQIAQMDKSLHAGLISRLKIMAGADISERRVPQDGRIVRELGGREVDIRVSTLPTIHGEKAVLRILDRSRGIPTMTDLGMNPKALERFRQLLRSAYGMILVCGPTGSGKTTTLSAALSTHNDPGLNVITIEDPVEYTVDGVNQVAVNPRAGLTFASGLRSMLRQDPDVILVGEIRDAETAEMATRAALTGHLVLSTLHTNDAVGAIARLIDMEVERFLVAGALMGVAAQRLVRRLCSRCKQPYTVRADDPHRFALGLPDEPVQLWRAVGCDYCRRSGYRGRVGLYEVLTVNRQIRDLIAHQAEEKEILAAARGVDMQTLLEDGVEKVLEGLTSAEEVLRVTYAE